jgi:asparagine synthetase B (glutamine-hydrolysing)
MAQYIDKSAVVAEIKRRIDRNNEKAASYSSGSEHDYLYRVEENVYKDLISFLNTLEVKEVDLEKELKHLIGNVGQCDRKLAKHFFELGLKVQQGE